MNIKIEKVKSTEKDLLFNLLQFALYDGSKYIDNKINDNGLFEYRWFDNYFTDNDRYCFFIKEESNNNILGFVMINSHMKIYDKGFSVAEFLVLPQYRRHHIGKKAIFEILNELKGNWEIEPIDNSDEAYGFWNSIVREYTNGNYEYKENIFLFNNEVK